MEKKDQALFVDSSGSSKKDVALSDIGQFKKFSEDSGIVCRRAGKTLLEAKGKGIVILNCLLPNGSTSTIRLVNVRYVPPLGHAMSPRQA